MKLLHLGEHPVPTNVNKCKHMCHKQFSLRSDLAISIAISSFDHFAELLRSQLSPRHGSLPSGFPVASQWLPSGPASSVMVSPNSLETLLRFFRLIVLQKNDRKNDSDTWKKKGATAVTAPGTGTLFQTVRVAQKMADTTKTPV